ncbi:MAG: pirin family protein [Propionibacteriales bacterium]|nr:pirin family protein [Propionibacteriales bacterium]
MPAVTVNDWTVLPRVIAASPEAEDRAPIGVTTAPLGYEGEGFPVHRAFAGVDPRRLDPFIHMDQMGEVDYAPGEPKGTSWHPHRGFETVTYMLDGVFDHADNHGGGGSITDGDTQWMTAGAGLLHIEAPPEWLVQKGGLFHGLQLWVNLPRAQKLAIPRYQDLRANDVGLAATTDAGALIRVIAGEVGDVFGPGSTHTPMAMVHATVLPGAAMTLPWRTDFNALVYIMSGEGHVGRERTPIASGQLAVLGHGETVTVGANVTQDSRHPALEVVVLGGLPIREPMAWGGPFVMNSKAEVVQAFEDFQKGRFGLIPSAPMPHEDVEGEYDGG